MKIGIEAIPALERSLIGTPLEEEVLTTRIAAFLTERSIRLPGVEAADLAKAIALTQTAT